ncbi:MAG: peptide deformylase [Candidatus Nomurabacteria bacterium GW2011_GWF2_43_8]|uniref:Peptide deformylase n=2 Tax=Candidatus Nomuraibacteriota TaxID=1752729 RepID=A0A0G1FIB4_9BACT|nr:MAG: peptide deformylase [Candidatus Nomurabacteria bacterium GW2011_GWB1_43_7]KKT22125.1 MAG: peptide deformylase [Candidatus Nomurabacteria bacterium GW2011_GWF2_43_8]
MRNNQQQIIRKGFRPKPVMPKKSEPTAPSSPPRPRLQWRHLPKAIYFWLRFRSIKALLAWRNRPMKILIYPNKRLKRIAVPVDFEKTTREQRMAIVRKLGVSLAQQQYGDKLGISAPQIGINLRVMVVRGNVMFNPEWHPTKASPNQVVEGCYSVPRKVFRVPRAPYGWAKWTNIDGRPIEAKLNRLPAIVFQHELDHLNGKCLADVGEEIVT